MLFKMEQQQQQKIMKIPRPLYNLTVWFHANIDVVW